MKAWIRHTLLATIALSAVTAAARDPGAIAVIAVGEPPGPGARVVALADALHGQLAALATPVFDRDALRTRMTDGAVPSLALAALDRALARASEANGAGEFEAANRELHSVVDALEALPEGPAVFKAWTQAMLRLARSEQELGRGVDAQATLERLLRADPSVVPDRRQYPPSFLALVGDAGERLRSADKVSLSIEASPPALVYVDGRDVGATPVNVALPAGTYRIAGRCAGLHVPATRFSLDAQQRSLRLDTSLCETLRPGNGPGLALPLEDRPALARAVAARLSLERAVMVTLVRNGGGDLLAATLFDTSREGEFREGRVPLIEGHAPEPALRALASYLLGGARSAPVLLPGEPLLALTPAEAERALGTPGRPPEPSWRLGARGWSAIGTGALAIAFGTAAFLKGREAQARYDDARAMVDPSGALLPPYTVDDYNGMIDRGDQRRNVAIGAGVGAGVSVLATGLLTWMRATEPR